MFLSELCLCVLGISVIVRLNLKIDREERGGTDMADADPTGNQRTKASIEHLRIAIIIGIWKLNLLCFLHLRNLCLYSSSPRTICYVREHYQHRHCTRNAISQPVNTNISSEDFCSIWISTTIHPWIAKSLV